MMKADPKKPEESKQQTQTTCNIALVARENSERDITPDQWTRRPHRTVRPLIARQITDKRSSPHHPWAAREVEKPTTQDFPATSGPSATSAIARPSPSPLPSSPRYFS